MTKPIGAIWRVVWSNPYTEPPAGCSRVKAERIVAYGSEHYNKPPEEIEQAWVAGKWAISWCAITKPPKRLSKDTLKSRRRKLLKNKLDKNYPLFSDQFYQEDLQNKSDYFNGETDQDILQGQIEEINKQDEIYQECLKVLEGEK